jgi:hypothetical protein
MIRYVLAAALLGAACPSPTRGPTAEPSPATAPASTPASPETTAMDSIDRIIDVLTQDTLDLPAAQAALAEHAGVSVHGVPGTAEVSHADLALDPPVPIDDLVARYGAYVEPPAMPGRTLLAFYPQVPPDRRHTAALFVTEVEGRATSATVRRDAR